MASRKPVIPNQSLCAEIGSALDAFRGKHANKDTAEALRNTIIGLLSETYDDFDVVVSPDPNDPTKMNVTTKLYGEDDKPSELERVGKIVEEVLAGR